MVIYVQKHVDSSLDPRILGSGRRRPRRSSPRSKFYATDSGLMPPYKTVVPMTSPRRDERMRSPGAVIAHNSNSPDSGPGGFTPLGSKV